MQYFLFGLAALALVLLATRGFVVANPTVLARRMRIGSGLLVLALAAVLALRGGMSYAFWTAALGTWLLGGLPLPGLRGGWSGPRAAQTSRVVTEYLDVELEHDTGAINGQILKGFFAGQALERLRPLELAHLWADCQFADPASAQILEVYLDRIHPTWRDDMARSENPSGADRARPEADRASQSRMSREEALDILGLKPGAGVDDIRRAHRDLMLKLHPDRGGSHILAAKVNEAKDVLLDGA